MNDKKYSASFTSYDWNILEDALHYYEMSMKSDGPEDYPLRDVQKLSNKVTTRRESAEMAEP